MTGLRCWKTVLPKNKSAFHSKNMESFKFTSVTMFRVELRRRVCDTYLSATNCLQSAHAKVLLWSDARKCCEGDAIRRRLTSPVVTILLPCSGVKHPSVPFQRPRKSLWLDCIRPSFLQPLHRALINFKSCSNIEIMTYNASRCFRAF